MFILGSPRAWPTTSTTWCVMEWIYTYIYICVCVTWVQQLIGLTSNGNRGGLAIGMTPLATIALSYVFMLDILIVFINW
jgi:hypothetical protein